MIRFILGIPLAILATGALFVVMHGLVAPGDVVLPDKVAQPIIDIFMDDPDPPETKTAERPDTEIEAPEPPVLVFAGPDRSGGPLVPQVLPPTPVLTPGPARNAGVLMPIATLAPQFPGRCQARGTEGYAVVRYDVTSDGRVANAQVVERSHRCFEDAALQAIRGWRYQPSFGSEAYAVRGLTQRFAFELDEA